MQINRQHKNGTILEAIKTYEELSPEEKDMLIIPVTNTIEQYEDFRVDYNKKGKLTSVKPHSFTEEYSEVVQKGAGSFNAFMKEMYKGKIDMEIGWNAFLSAKS